jgi:RNA polymerase sigma-70 factor (ECF subfamily)
MSRRRFGRAQVPDDRPLIVRAREQPELFGQFFRAEHEQVLAYFARNVLDPETAFDLMAETFARAFDHLPRFRGSTAKEGYAWLWAIARHQLYRWRERGVAERGAIERLGIQTPPMTAAEYERIEELADLQRARPTILAGLGDLTDDQRAAIGMRVIDEIPYAEIARSLGVTEAVVRARVSRGLRRLGQHLEPESLPIEEECP